MKHNDQIRLSKIDELLKKMSKDMDEILFPCGREVYYRDFCRKFGLDYHDERDE